MIKRIIAIAALLSLALPAMSARLQSGEGGPSADDAKTEASVKTASKNGKPRQAARHAPAGGNQSADEILPDVRETSPSLNSNSSPVDDRDETGGATTLNEPAMWILGAALIVLMLGMHAFHIISVSNVKQELAKSHDQLHRAQRDMQKSLSSVYGNNSPTGAALEKLSSQLDQQHQALGQLSAQLEELRRRSAAADKKLDNATTAIATSARLAGESRIQQEIHEAAGEMAESDRALAARIVERYCEIFGANSSRVKALAQAMSALDESLAGRSHLPADLVGRVHMLQQEICQFDRWHADASGRLSSLRGGSIDVRLTAFRSNERKVAEAFNLGEISVIEFVKKHAELVKQYFPESGTDAASLSPADHERELKGIAAGATDYLMDWFDRLFQLQSQLVASPSSAVPRAVDELDHIQRLAREALGKFDIQPEEIQAGHTSFDNRLYDAALVTQSSQFPANTIVGVHQCGFRRISTGEVLRRPKVVVAGVGAAS